MITRSVKLSAVTGSVRRRSLACTVGGGILCDIATEIVRNVVVCMCAAIVQSRAGRLIEKSTRMQHGAVEARLVSSATSSLNRRYEATVRLIIRPPAVQQYLLLDAMTIASLHTLAVIWHATMKAGKTARMPHRATPPLAQATLDVGTVASHKVSMRMLSLLCARR